LQLDPETKELKDDEPGKHQHLYIKFMEKKSYSEVLDIINIFLGEEPFCINLQVCRSPKAVLLYLSKEDKATYFHNVPLSRLSLYARAWYHAKKTYKFPQPINKADPFIISCGQNSRFALNIMEQQVELLRKTKQKNGQNTHQTTSVILPPTFY
jgi:hypothetical protein